MRQLIIPFCIVLYFLSTPALYAQQLSEQEKTVKEQATHFDEEYIIVKNKQDAHIPFPIYMYDEKGLYINWFVSSELKWEDQGVSIIQEIKEDNNLLACFTIETEGPVQIPFLIRYPAGDKRISVRINRKEYPVKASPGTYITLNRTWQDMDIIEVELKSEYGEKY